MRELSDATLDYINTIAGHDDTDFDRSEKRIRSAIRALQPTDLDPLP